MKIFAETERLILRELIPGDAPGIFALDSDAEVQRYVGNKPLTHIDQATAVIDFIRKQYEEHGIGRWAMIDKSTQEFLGWTGLKLIRTEINHHQHFYDMGYRLIRKHWGKGYATESALASVRYGFDVLQLSEIFAMADSGNLASQHVLEKAGMTYVNDFMYEGDPHRWYEIRKSILM